MCDRLSYIRFSWNSWVSDSVDPNRTDCTIELNFNLLDLFHLCGYHILSMENSKCMLYITRISRDVRILKKTLEHFLSLTKDCSITDLRSITAFVFEIINAWSKWPCMEKLVLAITSWCLQSNPLVLQMDFRIFLENFHFSSSRSESRLTLCKRISATGGFEPLTLWNHGPGSKWLIFTFAYGLLSFEYYANITSSQGPFRHES